MSKKRNIQSVNLAPAVEPVAVVKTQAVEPVAIVSTTGVMVRNVRKGGGKVSVCGVDIEHGAVAKFDDKSAKLDYAVSIGLIEYVND